MWLLHRAQANQGDKGTIDLWRGMKNLLPDEDFVSCGGAEPSPMSTTMDLSVAFRYSLSKDSLLFKIRTKTWAQRGADITYLSAFPAEREYAVPSKKAHDLDTLPVFLRCCVAGRRLLYPPLTFLHPTGNQPMKVHKNGITFTVLEVEPFLSGG